MDGFASTFLNADTELCLGLSENGAEKFTARLRAEHVEALERWSVGALKRWSVEGISQMREVQWQAGRLSFVNGDQ